jgi:hypothetical protein
MDFGEHIKKLAAEMKVSSIGITSFDQKRAGSIQQSACYAISGFVAQSNDVFEPKSLCARFAFSVQRLQRQRFGPSALFSGFVKKYYYERCWSKAHSK